MVEPRFLVDTYLEWAHAEGVPIVEDFGFDLLALETRPWPRFGVNGALALTKGRGDYLDMRVLEIPPGGATTPQKHLFEEVVYVLDGRGSTTIEAASGEKHNFEWGTMSVFALPLNARYRHFNGSGQRPARLVSVTNLPLVLNAFHDEAFVFNNGHDFLDRGAEGRFFKGEGEFIPMRPGRHMWATNFVQDLSAFPLEDWEARGAGGSNIIFILANGTMHAHLSEMPVGTYKKAHRHEADFHVFAVSGHGYSLYWYEGEPEIRRFDWRHGTVFAPTNMLYHQHFNTSPEPARYLAVAFGSMRYPFSQEKKNTFLGVDVNVKDGGRQIEYEDQDERVHRLFVAELARHGTTPRMDRLGRPIGD